MERRQHCHPECTASAIFESQAGLAWRKLHYGMAKIESGTGSSIILAAFGMDVMASYAFTYPSHVPSWLMTLLAVNTVTMISMHSFAFMIGTCLKPYMYATSKEYHPPSETELHQQLEMVPTFSPHLRFSGFIRVSHQISHVFGLFVFMVEIVLIAWVKFWDVSLKACIASTVIMLPFMVAFVLFYWYFNFHYKTQIYKNRAEHIENVENLYNQMSQQYAEACQCASEPRERSSFSSGGATPRRRKSMGNVTM